MKREEILVYISSEFIHLYLVNAKKEVIERFDNSFFRYGEISDVEGLTIEINKAIGNHNIYTGLFKPMLHVLYNDVTNCDLKYLYKAVLSDFNYSDIRFYELSGLIHKINSDTRVVVYDKNYYTLVKKKCKVDNLDNIDFEPIVIGIDDKKNVHFSDKDIIWNQFKYYTTIM